jgi:hypothetical protein
MKESFTSFASNLPCLFPSIEESFRVDYDASEQTEEISDYGKGFYTFSEDNVALIEGNVLTIFQLTKNDDDWSSEMLGSMEFEHSLNLVSWDLSGSCLAVSDSKGIIHLITKSGTLLFSKPLFSGNQIYSSTFLL